LYEPDIKTDKVMISLHGNGSSVGFYSVNINNTLGKELTSKGIAYLSFSNTGAHLIQSFNQIVDGEKKRFYIGVAYELIKNCVQDIDGAVEFVKSKGYKHLYLFGNSTGANKICVYNKYKPNNPFEKYILKSGGDDAGIRYYFFGKEKFKKVLSICKAKIKSGKGRNLIPKYISNEVVSFQSYFDQLDPDGDYNTFPFYWGLNNIKIMKKKPFGEISLIKKPTLIIYGEKDEYCYGRVSDCVDLIKKKVQINKFKFEIIPDADHGFDGKEKELALSVVGFLRNKE